MSTPTTSLSPSGASALDCPARLRTPDDAGLFSVRVGAVPESLADVYEAGDYEVSIQWWDTGACTSTKVYVDDVHVDYQEPEPTETPTPTPSASATPTPGPTATPDPLAGMDLTLNPYFDDVGLDYWVANQWATLCSESDPYTPCVRLGIFGEIKQTFEMPYYGSIAVVVIARQTTCPANTVYVQLCLESEQYGRMCNVFPLPYNDEDMYYVMYDHMPDGDYTMYARYYGVGCVNGQIILQVAAALGKEGEPPEQTATPWPTSTRLVPPSPTPRAVINTPIGSSNIDNILKLHHKGATSD